MIFATRDGGNLQARMFELSALIPRPGSPDAIYGSDSAGVRIPMLKIAAAACAARLVSETLASFTLRTFEGDAQNAKPVLDSDQAHLFQNPTLTGAWTSYDLIGDTTSMCMLDKGAFLWKNIVKGKVVELYPIDPEYAIVKGAPGGQRRIEMLRNGKWQDVTRNVLYIRGWSPLPTLEGSSAADLHREQIRAAASYEQYKSRYFDNDGSAGLIFEHPGNPDKKQRADFLESWASRRAGPNNAGRVGMVWGGIQVKPFAPNMQEAQAPELADAIVRDTARMFGFVPVELLAVVVRTAETPEALADKFIRFTCNRYMRRLARALHADPDLFPDKSLWPRFDISEFLRGDIQTTALVIENLVQAGILTKNEGRAMWGLPPVAGGDVFIQVPVGGGGDMGGPDAPGGGTGDTESPAADVNTLAGITARLEALLAA